MKKGNHINLDWTNWVVVLVMVGGLGYCLYQGYVAITGETDSVKEVVQEEVSKATDNQQETSLKLNNTHQRLGSEIVVDPNNLGKSNPFMR